MSDKWNEELRRAYDRGYWDARREFEHHLRQSHSDTMRDEKVPGGFMGDASSGRGARGGYRGRGEEPRDGRGGYARHGEDDGRHRSGAYGSGQGAWGGRGEPREGYRDFDRERHRDYSPGHRSSDEHRAGRHDERGFFERVGDEVSSWFDRDDRRDSDFSRDYDRDVAGYTRK